MNEYLQMGVRQPTELAQKEDTCFYIPLCLVFAKSSSTTKDTRAVFDVSTKSSRRLSLNAVRQVWPVLQNDLCSIC
jgi:hypothetical protein